jgi:hypothetical protein
MDLKIKKINKNKNSQNLKRIFCKKPYKKKLTHLYLIKFKTKQAMINNNKIKMSKLPNQ